jgi:hypothetical protein
MTAMTPRPHSRTFVTVRDVLWRLTESHAAVSNLIGEPRFRGVLGTEARMLLEVVERQRCKLQAGILRFIDTHADPGVLDSFIQSVPDEDDLLPTPDDLAGATSAEALGVWTIELHRAAVRRCRQLADAGLSPAANQLFGDLANQLEAMAKLLAVALQDRTVGG